VGVGVGVGGGAVTMKLAVDLAVVVPATSSIGPLIAFTGTIATTVVAVTEVSEPLTPPKRTLVAPVRFVPMMYTFVPGGPDAGVNDVIVIGVAVGLGDGVGAAVVGGAVVFGASVGATVTMGARVVGAAVGVNDGDGEGDADGAGDGDGDGVEPSSEPSL
jgi:hypothetical protein